jgi:beta-phosphoglucomutase-like phosphatase (HAD superfamily)
VIEDSPAGVAAAKAAGMRVIGITTTHAAEELALADVIVAGLGKLAVTAPNGYLEIWPMPSHTD